MDQAASNAAPAHVTRLTVTGHKLHALNVHGSVCIAVVVDQPEDQRDIAAGRQTGQADGDRFAVGRYAGSTRRGLAFTDVEECIAGRAGCVDKRAALGVEQGRL